MEYYGASAGDVEVRKPMGELPEVNQIRSCLREEAVFHGVGFATEHTDPDSANRAWLFAEEARI